MFKERDISWNRKELLGEEWSVMQFWFERNTEFSNLCAIVYHIFSNPVSEYFYETAFSELKLFIDDEWSRLRISPIMHVIIMRSSYK